MNKYEYVKKSINLRREWVDSTFKAKPCKRCGIQYPPFVMDFHHEDPKTKKFNIGRGSFTKSKKDLEEEISKCILLCSNCHRIVEHELRLCCG